LLAAARIGGLASIPMNALFRFVSRRRWWLITLLVIVAAGSAYALLRKPANPEERWRTVTVERGSISQVVAATGTLQPTAQVNVGTQVSGTVARVFADFNQPVKAGQVLAEMDPALFRSAVKQAEATVASANAQLSLAASNEERNRSLVQQQFIAKQALEAATQQREAAQAALQVARAQLERAQTDLANSVIRAPVDGVVIDRKVDVGQTVAASFQTPNLFVIARDLAEMEIHTSVSEADVGSVREGMPVQFRVDAHFDRRFEGAVRQIRLNPKSEQGVVTYNVVIKADNADRMLLPGMTARVDIVAAQRDNVLKLANAALRFRPTASKDAKGKNDKNGKDVTSANDAGMPAAVERDRTPRVYRLRDGKITPIEVRTGISDGRTTELVAVTSQPDGGPLAEGDRLVIRDMQARQAGEVNFSF
jgi:HlyD family secretion protein